jgi:hypothetical protein
VLADPARVVDISADTREPEVEFSYSVKWEGTEQEYDDRLARYERFPLNPVHLEVGVQGRPLGRGAGPGSPGVLRAFFSP